MDKSDLHINKNEKFSHLISCHYKWYLKTESNATIILKRASEWLLELDDDEKSHYSIMNIYLIKAISLLFSFNSEESINQLQNAKNYLEEHKDDPTFSKEHLMAYSYLTLANEYYIMKKIKPFTSGTSSLFKNVLKYNTMGRSNKFTAAVLAAKAAYFGIVRWQENKLRLLKQVVKLDPECSEFWLKYSRAVRSARVETIASFVRMPTEIEVGAVLRAFILNKNSSITLQRYSLLLEDTLKASFGLTSSKSSVERNSLLHIRDQKEIYSKMLGSISKAAHLSPNSVKVNIKLAEVLKLVWSKTTDETLLNQAEVQFLKCLEKWPENSEVLQKTGSFYFYSKNNFSLALKLYSESLLSDPENYGCLMRKLKVFVTLHRFDEAEHCITEQLRLNSFLTKIQMGQLYRYKGVMTWIMGKENDALNTSYISFNVHPESATKNVWYEFRDIFKICTLKDKKKFEKCMADEFKQFLKKFYNYINRRNLNTLKYTIQTALTEYLMDTCIDIHEPIKRQFVRQNSYDGDYCPW